MSSFAYLEWRFSSRARRVCALLFVLRTALYLAVVLLAPARAIQAVNPDFSMVLSICVGGAVATAYTVVGGMSAVIYTDLLQSITLIAAMIGAIAVCCHALSAARIASPATWRWEVGAAWAFPGALEPGAESSGPWYVLGTFFQAIGQSGCDQIAVQRYLSLRGEEGGAAADGRAVRRAQRSAIGTGVLNTAVSAALSFLGILIGAYYSQSGPGANAAPQLASGDELPALLFSIFPRIFVFFLHVVHCFSHGIRLHDLVAKPFEQFHFELHVQFVKCFTGGCDSTAPQIKPFLFILLLVVGFIV